MRFNWLLVTIIMGLGCNPDQFQKDAPVDRPYYPSALLQDDVALYVVSSNYDQRFERGTVLSIDLGVVDTEVAAATDGTPVTIGNEAVTSSGYIPSLVDGATLSPANDQIFMVSRADRTLRTIPLANKKIACSTGLGQDCFSQAPAAVLTQNNPYFVLLTPTQNGQGVAQGIIGYPLGAAFYRASSTGTYPLPAYFELQSFTWNAATNMTQTLTNIAFGNLFDAKQDRNFNSNATRVNVRIGDLIQRDGELFVLFEAPSTLVSVKSILLARVALSDLEAPNPNPQSLALYDLGVNSSIHSAGPIAIRTKNTNLQVFAANEAPGILIKLEFPASVSDTDAQGNLKVSAKTETSTCDHVNDLALSPDDANLVVACADGRILVYDTDSLRPFSIDPQSGAVFGRAPLKIHFDSRTASPPFRFYTANFHDGSISIYDLLDEQSSPNTSLVKERGHIFTPSPLNREGGI